LMTYLPKFPVGIPRAFPDSFAYWHCLHSMRCRVYETIVRPSVRLSVCSIVRPQPRRAVGLLLSAVLAGEGRDIDRKQRRRAPTSSGAAARRRSNECEQCHVHSRRRKLKTDLSPKLTKKTRAPSLFKQMTNFSTVSRVEHDRL